ncbi:unnamed protein product [Caenorhabditis brenneri]
MLQDDFKSSASVHPFIRTPECRICTVAYDDNRHLPKILQCAHTICNACINVLEAEGRRRAGNMDMSQVYIVCPVCRMLTQAPRNSIRTNYQLIDVVDVMRGEANHNVVFITCIECNGVYHEKDANICSNCSLAKQDSADTLSLATEILSQKTSLSKYALCSTCLLKNHIRRGHQFVLLQPVRIEMQRQENLKRILALESKLKAAQASFRGQLHETMEKWLSWSSKHDASMTRFMEATDSFNQKKQFDEFVKLLTRKTERIESLIKGVQRWSDDLNVEFPTEAASTTTERVNPTSPVVVENPPHNTPPLEPRGPDFPFYF